MSRDLEADLKLLRTVASLAEARDIRRASELAERALAEGFEHPLLLNVLATRHEHAGDFDAALGLLERAVAIAPDDLGARNALALCLQRVGRAAEAIPHVERLIAAYPTLGFLQANLGNALMAVGLLGRAESAHRRALELEPRNVAAMAALATIAVQRGQRAEARERAGALLALIPGYPDAVIALATAELGDGEIEPAEHRLRALLGDARVGAAERARAQGLLGDVLDAAGRAREAGVAYTACNESLRALHARLARGQRVTDYAQALERALAKSSPALWEHAPDPGERPAGLLGHAFLVGFPRSGTTLLEVVLDGHPAIASTEEVETLFAGAGRYLLEPFDFDALARADAAELAPYRAAYWQAVQDAGVDVNGKVFIDKLPLNTLKLPLIARLFPEARILFARRDPRDVVLSCFRRRFAMNPAMYELLTLPGAAALYDAAMRIAAGVEARVALPWTEVRYERVVEDLPGETARLCRFLGLDMVPGMADFADRVRHREHATPSTAQLTRGLDASGIGHWRHYEDLLRPVLPALEPWVRRFGYPG